MTALIGQHLAMALVACSVDINRPPAEVFPFATDPTYFGEWQRGVVRGHVAGEPAVGTVCTMTRMLAGTERASTSEITEYEPPLRWAMRGLDGPIRSDVCVFLEGLDADTHSRLTISLELCGHGLGKLLAPFAVNKARKDVPMSCQRLKDLLETNA
jgi:Polyketide cyclase / dehydrase and lipid transport